MNDAEADRLRERLTAAAAAARPDPSAWERIERRLPQRPSRRRVSLSAAAAVLAVVAIGATVLALARDDGTSPARLDVVPPSTVPPSTVLSSTMPPDDAGPVDPPVFPLEVRHSAALVWTGEEIVVWGGELEGPNVGVPDLGWREYADGAAFDPRSATWRTMAPAPLPAIGEFPIGVWTGTHVVIATDRSLAAWDPATDTWTALPDLPADAVAMAWTGDEVVVVGPNVAVDIEGRTMRALPEPPGPITRGRAFWTGTEVLVFGATQPIGSLQGEAAGYAYDPGRDRWRVIPPSGLDAQAIDSAWTGRELVAANYDLEAAAYDPQADEWRRLPDAPARAAEWSPVLASVGSRVLAEYYATTIVLDEDRWIPLPARRLAASQRVVADERLWEFGIDRSTAKSRLVEVALPTDPRSIQVDLFRVELPDGWSVRAAELDRLGPRNGATVVRVDAPGGSCTLRGSRGEAAPRDEAVIAEQTAPPTWLTATCAPTALAEQLQGRAAFTDDPDG